MCWTELKAYGSGVVGRGPRGPTDQGLNSRLLPQTLVVPPQTKLHLPVTLQLVPLPHLSSAETVPAERVAARLQPLPSPTPTDSPTLSLGASKNQNPQDLPLRLSHHVPLWFLWGRWQPLAKQTSKQGMMCQSPLLAVTPKLYMQFSWAPISQLWGGNHHRPLPSSAGS